MPENHAPPSNDPMTRPRPNSIAVFTGASAGRSSAHLDGAHALGEGLAERGITVVYGGGRVGLMGAVADAALAAGGRVVGVMPQHLVDGEIAHPGLSALEVVGSMHERKQRMIELADAFVALPGGAGTLDELFEAWTWQQLGLHAKPIALCGSEFWTPLLKLLDHMVEAGFIRGEDREALILADEIQSLLDELAAWTLPRPKWLSGS